WRQHRQDISASDIRDGGGSGGNTVKISVPVISETMMTVVFDSGMPVLPVTKPVDRDIIGNEISASGRRGSHTETKISVPSDISNSGGSGGGSGGFKWR
ncbi:hypothetical protein E4U09_004493, partial [Claviceps aff. purpurea]